MLGAPIGTAVGSKPWERARLPATVSLAPAPFGRGLRVGLRVTRARLVKDALVTAAAPLHFK